MENEGPKRVSAIKPDTEILGYPYGFNCYIGSSGKRERDDAEYFAFHRLYSAGVHG
jgi:hypothetical protein